ncbi:MAG: type III-B CRISPR module RAMP protein Cmr4 [Acidobacteriota bacterium]
MSYLHRRYLLMTLDPTHIGAGGYRIGRVDNSIIREPGTNLPKIPGTSLSGAIRSYAAYRYGKIRCAGQGQEKIVKSLENGQEVERKKDGHCGKNTCPICYTFGFTVKGNDDSERSYSGTVNIYDAHILLFPVSSMIGPLWISTKNRLIEFGFNVDGPESNESYGAESCVMTQPRTEPINLGWLMLPVNGIVTITPPTENNNINNWDSLREWTSIHNRIVLVPESLFSQLINSGLEIRTSVSIDPTTGAAESGALFTYEAIPRATLFAFDLVQDDYRTGVKPWTERAIIHTAVNNGEGWTENAPTGAFLYTNPNDATKPALDEQGQPKGWRAPYHVVESALEWASALGIGGMSTRGFGRIGLVGSGWNVPHNDLVGGNV